MIKKKREVLRTFESIKLEKILRESTKSSALDLVSTLLPTAGAFGILVDLEAGSKSPSNVGDYAQACSNIQTPSHSKQVYVVKASPIRTGKHSQRSEKISQRDDFTIDDSDEETTKKKTNIVYKDKYI